MKNSLHREPGFYRWMCLLAAPMVLQNLITTSLGFVDTFMVGLLGNAEMAAVIMPLKHSGRLPWATCCQECPGVSLA